MPEFASVIFWDRVERKAVAATTQLTTGRFMGRVVRTARAVEAQFTLVKHGQPICLPWHSHEAAYFCLLLNGSYIEYYGDQSIDYRPFMMAFHPPHYGHYDEIRSADSVFFVVELSDAWVERLREIVDLGSVKVELRGNDMVWLMMRIFKEFMEGFNADSDLHIESLLYESVAMAARLPDRLEEMESAWFGSALRFIDARFTEALSMRTIADAAGVHPATLARAFRRNFQQTASEYVQRLRTRRACELILGGDAGLSSVSADCGFADQSHFTKVFKDVTGMTPTAFRESVGRAM
jgi:AraC family transcriptional regulator